MTLRGADLFLVVYALSLGVLMRSSSYFLARQPRKAPYLSSVMKIAASVSDAMLIVLADLRLFRS